MESFFAWYNLVFYVSILVGILLVLGSTLGIHYGDFSHDVNCDHDVDAEGDYDIDHDHDHQHEGTVLDSSVPRTKKIGLLRKFFFAIMGFGRVPITIILMIFFLFFGGIGLVCNRIVENYFPHLSYVYTSIPIAIIGTILVMRIVTRIFAKYMPSVETYVIRDADVIGRTGILITGATTTFGVVQVNMGKDILQKPCRTLRGSIDSGEIVRVVGLDDLKNILVVGINQHKTVATKSS